MSIWVRLIGGPANGQVQKIDPDQIEIVVRERVPAGFMHRHHSLTAATTEVKSARYTRRVVHMPPPATDIVFFADDALSDFEALQSVLGP